MIVVGQNALSLHDFSEILFNNKLVELRREDLDRVDENFTFLKSFSANKIIYGINTGFGPMAQYKVPQENLVQLQYNLIRSHSSGSGNILPPILSRALMIARLNMLMQARSGVHLNL